MWRLSVVSFVFLLSGILLLLALLANAKGPPERATKYKSRHVVRTGASLRLSCPVHADPPALVSWLKDGQRIHFGWERYHVRRNRLVIEQLQLDDAGAFVCTATNGFGTVTARHLVYVADDNQTTLDSRRHSRMFFKSFYTTDTVDATGTTTAPESIHSTLSEHTQLDITRQEGSRVKLRCVENVQGPTNITWFKDGERIAGRSGVDVLVLRHLTFADEGRYVCVSIGQSRLNTRTFHVIVTGQFSVQSPLLSSYFNNVTVMIGNNVTLVCQIYSQSQLTVQWLRPSDDIVVPTGNTVRRKLGDVPFIVLQSGVFYPHHSAATRFHSNLTLSTVTKDDAGRYVCLVQNKQGLTYLSTLLIVDSAFQKTNEYAIQPTLPNTTTWLAIGGVTLFVITIVTCVMLTVVRRRIRQHNILPTQQVEAPVSDVGAVSAPASPGFDNHHYSPLEQLASETMSDDSKCRMLI